jgi:two-component system sensor histidine kinase MprB
VTLRARLIAGTASLLAIAVGVGLVVAYLTVRNQLYHQLDAGLESRAKPLIAISRRKPQSPLGSLHPKFKAPALGGPDGYVQFVRANGTIVLEPGQKAKLPSAGARLVAAGTRGASFTEATVSGTHVRIFTTRLRTGTAVEVARPLTEIDHVLSRLRLLFLFISVLAIAGAGGAALLLSKALMRPVRQLTDHAERIAATGDLSERTDQNRTDELGRLAVAFNTMLDALAASVTAQRQLVADASHELRTPLTTARTNLEVVELHHEMPAVQRRRILSEAHGELKEMTHLIDELVDLARGEAQVIEKQSTRLDLVAGEVVDIAARRTGREFRTELRPTMVEGSPTALARAIVNLVDNALKWGPPDTPVHVTVREGVVRVRDHGPGIAPEDVPRVFDRFYRAAAARTLPGSGLGLAIVRQIAEAHDGTVAVEPAEQGGSEFTLRIPVIPGSAA